MIFAGALARMLQNAFGDAPSAPDLNAPLDLTTVPGIGPRTAGLLEQAGFSTLQSLVDATPEALQEVEGIGPKTAVSILNWANEQAEKAQAAEPADSLGAGRPVAVESSSSMNDQDFMAALSRAFKESEDRAKVAEDAAQEETEQAPEGERE